MTHRLSAQTSRAFFWRGLQIWGVKAIFLIRTLVLARLLVPEDFGLLAIALVTVEFSTRITDFGMVQALVQKKDADRSHYDVAWTLNLIRAAVVTASIIFLAPWIAQLFSEPRAVSLIRVVAFKPMLMALASIGLAGQQRDLRLRPQARLRLVESVVNTVIAIGLATRLGVWAMVAGVIGGAVVYMVGSYLVAPHRPRWRFESGVATGLVEFGRWVLIVNILGMTAGLFLRIAISRQLGTAALGVYFLASKLAFLLSDTVSDLLGSVTFPLYSRLQEDLASIRNALQGILLSSYMLLAPASVLLIAVAPALTETLLGEQWAGTGPLIRVLTLVGLIGLLGEVVVPVLYGLGQPQKVVILEVVQSTLVVGLTWWLVGQIGVLGAGVAWLPAIVLSQILGIRFLRDLVERPFAGVIKPLIAVLVSCCLAGALCWLVAAALPGLGGLVLALGLGVVVVLLLYLLGDSRLDSALSRAVLSVFPQLASWGYFSRRQHARV
jgi:lipopolysaccharide exporter